MRNALRVLLLALWVTPQLFGAVQRTFVSTAGLDTNPCTPQQPCRTFGAAIAQTLANGEVYVLDTGGYGPATITSPVAIRAEGVTAGVSVFSGNGMTVNITGSQVVTLRGITFNGVGGINGVEFQGVGTLHLEKCSFSSFIGAGVDMSGSGALSIDDSFIRDDTSNYGLWVHPSAGNAYASVDGTRFENNGTAVAVGDNATVFVRNTLATNNGLAFGALSLAGPAVLMLETCMATKNTYGVSTEAVGTPPATVTISNVTVFGNTNGLVHFGGAIVSLGNNSVSGNGTDGSPTSTVPQM